MDSPIKQFNNVDNNNEPNMVKQTLITDKPYRQVRYLIFLVSLLCLSPFYYGYTLTYISTITPEMLINYFGQSAGKPVMIGILIGIVPIGAGVGALFAPIFMGFLSRKNFVLFFNAIAIMISGIIQINQLPLLLGCRFIQGFIVGNYMGVVPIYIKQMTPFPLRGSIGAMSQFFNIGAVVVCYALGLIFQVTMINKQFFWRFMFSFTALTVIAQSILLMFNVIPQSPTSLIQAGQLKQARRVLAMFNVSQVLDNVFSQYIKQSRRNKFQIRYRRKQKIRPKSEKIQMTQSINMSMKGENNLIFNVKDDLQISSKPNILINPSFLKKQSSDSYSIQIQTVLSKKDSTSPFKQSQQTQKMKISIKAFIIGFQIPLMQQLSGVKTIVTQISIIIHQYNKDLALYSPLLINIIQFIATACSILVLARFGRRIIILVGNFGVAVCSLVVGSFFLAIYYTGDHDLVFGAMAFIIIFMIFYGATIGPAVWLYVPQIVPAKIVPLATCMNWLGVTISVIVTPIIIQQVGNPYPVFFFFGIISFLLWILNYFFVIETKGLTPSQIAEKLA